MSAITPEGLVPLDPELAQRERHAALERALSPEESLLAEAVRQKDALFRLADRLQNAAALEQMYVAALDAILAALPRERASILLCDEQGSMQFVAWRGLSAECRAAVEGHSPWKADEKSPAPICLGNIQAADLPQSLKNSIQLEGIGSVGFFPLVGTHGLIGKFMTYGSTPRAFAATEIDLSLTIARQLALAIDRFRAQFALTVSEQRLRSELEDSQLLQHLSAELVEQENGRSLYEKILDAAVGIMHADFASMQVLEEGGGREHLQLLGHRGFNLAAVRYWQRVDIGSDSTCAQALRTHARVIVPDVDCPSFTLGAEDLGHYRAIGVRSVQTTPLFARSGKLVGMLSTHWRRPHSPDERALRVLEILARQAADIIERRWANNELTSIRDRLAQEVEDLRRLHEFSARLAQYPDVDSVLRDLLTATADLMQAGKASVQVYDRQAGNLRLVSTKGFPQSFAERFRYIDVDGFTTCAEALRSRQRVVVEDLRADPRFEALLQAAAAHGICAAQSTPVIDDSGAVAAVFTTYSDRPRAPSERELRLLDLYSEVTVRQIERKRSEEALRFLAEISAAFSPIGATSDIARITGEMVRAYFGAQRVSLCAVSSSAEQVTVFHIDGGANLQGGHATYSLSEYLDASIIEDLKCGSTVAVSDVTLDPRTKQFVEAYRRWNVEAMILTPHVSAGRWEFLLAVQRNGPYSWSGKDVEMLRELAARVHIRLERARAEEALAHSEAKLREDDRRKDEFLAMLAHELRNPLAPIVNAVQLLARSNTDDPIQHQVRAIIGRQAARLTRLVDDLLEVSRITSGRIQLHQENITLNGVIERAVETVRSLIEQHHHTLEMRLPTEPVWLYGDATRLEQILVNLLNNAAKYTNDGGRIQLRVETRSQWASVMVKDNGMGIEPELLPRIFDLFTQAERSLDRASGGLGIGLSLVQRLAQMHGGSVTVDSTVGAGSEFVLRLPLKHEPTRAPQTSTTGDATSTRSLRVLVVDDNVDAAQSLGMLLEACGHDVQVAYDGEAALQHADEHRPDIVFLDIGLPRIDGYEVAQRLRESPLHRATTLVAMTGYGQSADQERAFQAGFALHLVKPAPFSQVEAILADAAHRLAAAS